MYALLSYHGGYYLECGDLRVLASRHRCRRHCRCTYQAASCRAPSCLVAPQAAADASNTRLVEASADVTQTNREGESPLNYARRQRRTGS